MRWGIIRKYNLSKSNNLIISAVSSSTFLKITFAWFIVQAVYFSVRIKFGLPPDETYHYNFIQLFSAHLPSPILHSQGSYSTLPESIHNPFFLYHFLLAFPYVLVKWWSNNYIVLRLINVLIGLGSLFFIYKIANIAKISKLSRNLSIFMLVNTLMFPFISASINYDNLFIFLSLTSIYLLLKLFKKYSAMYTLLLFICLLAGLLVKINFIPIAFIVLVLFAYKYFRMPQISYLKFKRSFINNKELNTFLSVLLVFVSFLFIQRYIVNFISYGTYSPSCEKVRSIEDCRKSALYSRDEYAHGVGRKPASESSLSYTSSWSHMMEQRTYGIFTSSNRIISQSKFIKLWVGALVVLYLIAMIRQWAKNEKVISILIAVSIFYLLTLLLKDYSIYKDTGRFLAVQGRYILVVLPLIYLAGNYYLERLLKNYAAKFIFVAVTIVIFAVSSLPTYLVEKTPAWELNRRVSVIARLFSDF